APLSLTSDEIDFKGGANSVSGSGTVLLQPTTDTTAIDIGTPTGGTLQLSVTDLAALADGFTSITVGRLSGTAAIVMAGATFRDPLLVRTHGPSGTILVSGPVTGTGNASLDLEGTGAVTTLAGDLITAGAPITIGTDTLIVSGGPHTLDSTTGGT